MKRSTSLVIGAVILLFTVVLIGWYFTVGNKGQDSMKDSMSEYDDVMSNLADSKLSKYDNGSAMGSEIVDLIKNLDSSSEYSIIVRNKANQNDTPQSKTVYTYGDTDFASSVSDMQDRDEIDSYINPRASFSSSLNKDENNVITSIEFIQN